jgi:hypothetical protein
MLPSLTAVHLHRFMSSGRNHPALFGCVDPSGAPAGDYVVKLVGSMDMRERGAAFEFMASRLAVHFGIKTPEPAQITIDSELATWLSGNNPDLRRILDRSAGPNFGTRLLTDASLWPIGRPVPDAMLPSAIHIFAFDALISNDDRRMDNQNLLVRGDDIFVIDHEAAFAFLYLVASAERAWQCGQAFTPRPCVLLSTAPSTCESRVVHATTCRIKRYYLGEACAGVAAIMEARRLGEDFRPSAPGPRARGRFRAKRF